VFLRNTLIVGELEYRTLNAIVTKGLIYKLYNYGKGPEQTDGFMIEGQ